MKRVEFTPPEGLATPEGKADGDTFEMMATFKIKKGGRVCLIAMGDFKMPGYDDQEPRDEGREVAGNYRKAMNGSNSHVSNY